MNRKIKFRGKSNHPESFGYGDFVFGSLITRGELAPLINVYDENSSLDVRVDPNTVGQFTGLHLWSGKDLYEGDIVDVDYIFYDPTGGIDPRFEPSRCIVVYENTAFRFKNVKDRYYFIHEVRNIKIVGNIHDNPELWEGGEK